MQENRKKNPPKSSVKFSITLSEEQKAAKTEILKHPFNFLVGKAGSGKTLLDEFQNLTKPQFSMALGRLGKDSMMIFCGDYQQIDIKDENYSAIHEVAKIKDSDYVYKCVLEDNHRHKAIGDVLKLLTGY